MSDFVVNLDEVIKPEKDEVETNANILLRLAKQGTFTPEITDALYMGYDYLIGEYNKKRTLGNDLLIHVLQNYTVDELGNVRKRTEVFR